MIGKSEATAKAKKHWNGINYCTEYENAYLFSKKNDRSFGGPGPVAVLKDTGEMVNMTYFVDKVDRGKLVSEGYLK